MARQPLVPVDHRTIIPGQFSAAVAVDHVSGGTNDDGEQLGDIDTWVFSSRGLESLGHSELVLVVQQVLGARCPESPFGMFHAIYEQVRTGTTIEPHTRLGLEGATIDFDARVNGFMCLPFVLHQPRLPAIDSGGYQAYPLLLIPMIGGELDAAVAYGHGRVLARLGYYSRCFPYPWWFAPGRPPLATAVEESSVLAQFAVPAAHVPYVEVVQVGPHLDITLAREDCAKLHNLITTGPECFVLYTGMSESEDARYLWRPGQASPMAIMYTGGGSLVHGDLVIGANFLMLLHGDVDNATKLTEDGFVVMLPEPLWQRFVGAIEARQPFAWRSAVGPLTEISLTLEARQYVSPFGSAYEVEGTGTSRLRRYAPKPTSAKTSAIDDGMRNIDIDSVTLLTSQHDLGRATTAHDVGTYITDVCLVIDDALDGVAHRCESMVVHFRLVPHIPPYVAFGVRPDDPDVIPAPVADSLLARLQSVPAPPIKHTEIRFEVRLSFPGGTYDP